MTFFRCFCVLLILCCCNSKPNTEAEAIHVSVLRGPSAIAFAHWLKEAPVIDGKPVSVRIIDSPDLMQAALIKGEADIAVLPMISAANLYNKGIRYHLAGCPIWGTLYLAGRSGKEISGGNKPVLHIFGAGTTPDILTRHYLRQHKLDYTLNYSFTTAREIMQGLLAGKVDHAVLGEPFLSIALHNDSTLQILADLNRPDSASLGFAQTAILYAPALKKNQKTIDSLLNLSCRFAVEQPEQAIRILEKENIFASGMLTPESIERCKIDYKTASEAQENILRFLQLIGQYEPKALGGKMPDEKFYK
ncbi:ABC transporter substrate-binding protein [uncultured Parabacteroides sp.]|uniref:ABC transporter substrate-binding protein n=1 Tax=uncultured Parabacteroides sp. TaxID=512312 RepID=UPI002805553D|nr:ABC transporter substrate-binding protein [uncultured Parabacteroides sp.]